MTAVSVAVLYSYRRSLVPVQEAPAPRLHAGEVPPLIVAVGGRDAERVCAMAVPLAAARGGRVAVLHVVESDVLAGEDTIDLESEPQARTLLARCVARLCEAGVPVAGELLASIGTHADVAGTILDRAAALGAGAIAVGPDHRHGLSPSVTAELVAHAPAHVLVLRPDAGPLGRPVEAAAPVNGQALWRTHTAA